MAIAEKTEEKIKTKKLGRSPAYPYLSLADALERAKELLGAEGKNLVPITSAYQAWGYSPKSSGARLTAAAVKQYGLIEYEGSNEDLKVRLTKHALEILLDKRPDSPERDALTAQAALAPSVLSQIWEHYNLAEDVSNLPSDLTLETFLVKDNDYNEAAAKTIIGNFKQNLPLVKPANSDNMTKVKSSENTPLASKPAVTIGDLVQVEIGGNLQLEKAARVRGFQDHEGKKWAFVEGSETGIPMEQITLVEKGKTPLPSMQPPTLPLAGIALEIGWREERLLDDSGEEIFIRYKGEPTKDRYQFIHDYLAFKIPRLK